VPAPDGVNVVELSDDESYRFDEAGRMIHVGHVIYKVLTQKGAEGWDSLAVSWEPWHEARPEIRVRVIGPDGAVHTLDPKTITEAPARGGDYKIYSDGKRVTAPFPAIAPGVVVEEEYTETENQPLFVAGRLGRAVFGQEEVPVAHGRAVFDAPASLPLRTDLQLLPGVKPQRAESGGRVTLTYDFGPLEGIDPAEPYLPPEIVRFPTVWFSTAASWQSVASAYGKVVDERVASEAVKTLVAPLVAGKQTDAEKELALVDFLDREVRYTGIEFGESATLPHDPAETLAKKYGDCKDKSTLLVAMLRAAGIPAYVALLQVEERNDVPAALPGMGMFDHAIVYVPGKTPLWIDATDNYARLGELPGADQGRLALVTSAETTALLKTPESASKENGLVERRTFTLNDNGPAKVVEVTAPKGIYESGFRSYYADKPDKDTREGLRGYVETEYMCDNLTRVDRSDAADLTRPFELTIGCEKAKRGYTGLENAQAAVRVERMFQFLPDELKRKDDSGEKKKNDGPDKPKPPRTADWWLPAAFSIEWNYRFVPPAGFVAKELPNDATIALGPAVLSEKFSVAKDGAVEAHLVFDTVKRRYTADEARALSKQVAEVANGPAILINFEPEGAVLLRDGKVKEALASYRGLIVRNPNAAVHHLQLANVLLEAGMGEAARAEAKQAVKLDPNSALAERVLAEILKHDLVGRELRPGSDLDGAAKAYRAAIKLDPDDHSAQADLAILLEYDSVGRRYSGQAKMKEAIAEYEALGQDKLADLGLTNNLAFAKFYGGDYAGALKAARALNPEPKALIAACVAMIEGSKAGLADANKRSTNDDGFKETARTAGEMLMNIRQYAQAAEFYQAGAAGDNAARNLGLANMLRGAQRHEDLKFANTPADVVKHFNTIPFDPVIDKARYEALLSRNARKVFASLDADELKSELEAGKKMNSELAREGSSLDVTEDVLLQMLDPKGEGDDTTGYREKYQIMGGSSMTIYIVKEDGQYKLLDTSERPNSIALEMLDRIQAGDLKGAKTLLDWMREDQHLEGGDDPLGGPVFPRFWTKGAAAEARRMRLAAAAILVGTRPTAAQGVAILEPALKDAAGERERTNIQLALALGYGMLDNYAKLLDVATELAKQEPESKIAFLYHAQALMGLGRYDDALAVADERLKLLENDSDTLNMKMEIEAGRGDFTAAREVGNKLVAQGKESAEILNSLAWFALFLPKASDTDVAMAVKATQLAADNPHILHTLGSLYAATGDTKNAREVLLRAMDDQNLDEPNEDFWYAWGLIAEQYGEREIAIADYRKLKRPKEVLELPSSSWKLAQARLKALGAESK